MSHISCQEALKRIYEYLDGELPAADSDEIRRHLDICEGCYPEVKLTTELREALQRAAQGQPCCPDALRDRVAAMLQNEATRTG